LKLVEGGWEWLNCFNHPKKQGLSWWEADLERGEGLAGSTEWFSGERVL